jgi:hypothetical protein
MSFDWKSYLTIAEQLKTWGVAASLDEAKFRTSISRSYYSTFNLTREALTNKKGVNFNSEDIKNFVSNWGSHTVLTKILYTSNNSTVRNLGSDLEELKEMREDADYRVAAYKKIAVDFRSSADNATYKAGGIITDLAILDDSSATIELDRLKRLLN